MMKTNLRWHVTTIKKHCIITVTSEQFSIPTVTSRNLLWLHVKCSHTNYSKSALNYFIMVSAWKIGERIMFVYVVCTEYRTRHVSFNGSCLVHITLDTKSLALWSEYRFYLIWIQIQKPDCCPPSLKGVLPMDWFGSWFLVITGGFSVVNEAC